MAEQLAEQRMLGIGDPAPTTDEEAIGLLPGGDMRPSAAGLYQAYRDMGEDIIHALIKTLTACLPAHLRPTGGREDV